MYLLVPFILQNVCKKILELIESYEDVRQFRDQNGPFVLNKNFLVQAIVITFIYLLALFIVQNLKKILTTDPELWRCTILRPKVVHLRETTFFWIIVTIILIYLLALFIVQNFKKILPGDPEFWGCAIYGPFPQIRIFSENLLVSLVSFILAYLHAKNQSQILIY